MKSWLFPAPFSDLSVPAEVVMITRRACWRPKSFDALDALELHRTRTLLPTVSTHAALQGLFTSLVDLICLDVYYHRLSHTEINVSIAGHVSKVIALQHAITLAVHYGQYAQPAGLIRPASTDQENSACVPITSP